MEFGVPPDVFGRVAILLADVHDVLALALVSSRIRRALPPITELTIGTRYAHCFHTEDWPRLHWYSDFENEAEPEGKLAVLYAPSISRRPDGGLSKLSYLDAHAVIRRIPPSVAAEITHLSIECYLSGDETNNNDERRGPAYHVPVMHSYQPERPDGRLKLNHALRQHGAVFTALRGLEIYHPPRGFNNHHDGIDNLSKVVLGLCARALVRNTRRTLRHLAFKTTCNFSHEDFQECIFGDLEFLRADLTPFVAMKRLPSSVFDEEMARYETQQNVLSRIASKECINCKRLTVLYVPALHRVDESG